MQDAELMAALAPLHAFLDDGGCLRLTAVPGLVVLDYADGAAPAAVDWGEARHAAALDALGALGVGAARLRSGVSVCRAGAALVLHVPPRHDRRADDLVREGVLSGLAARMLSAALGLGRNVLVAGPWAASVSLTAALAADGARPALADRPGTAAPRGWPVVGSADEARAYGADRVAAWSLAAGELAELMRRGSGVIGWIDARRLDRALMRFEAGLGAGALAAPLDVLAALDLVVIVGERPAARVSQLAEIVPADDGYRPRLLFSSGLPPVPAALTPLDRPSFVEELAESGFGVLADELRAALVAPRTGEARASSTAFTPPASPVAAEPTHARGAGFTTRPESRARLSSPALEADAGASPPPGWELDRLDDEALGDAAVAGTSADDATLAATFGLGPPPRPAGARPTERRSFEDALRRAQARAESSAGELPPEAARERREPPPAPDPEKQPV